MAVTQPGPKLGERACEGGDGCESGICDRHSEREMAERKRRRRRGSEGECEWRFSNEFR